MVSRIESLPAGWKRLNGASTATSGWFWASNGASRFGGGYHHALVREVR